MYNIILLIIATYIVHYFTLIIVAVQFQYLVAAKAIVAMLCLEQILHS